MAGKGPAYEAFTVTEREGMERGWWTRIGSAFVNRDGSLSVVLDALPLNGRVILREPLDRDEPKDPPKRRASTKRNARD